MLSSDRPATRLATRLAFLVAGFGVACWAPIVPFAKERLQVDEGAFGLILLCLGVGSVAAMLATGMLSARYGSRPIILAGGFGLAALPPLLAIADTPTKLGLTLFGFGASLGSLDAAMNIHAIEVERAAAQPLMSGFHALFSVGGFIGATLITFLLSMSFGTLASALIGSALMAVAMAVARPRLLRSSKAEKAPLFVVPHGVVLLLAALAALMFLVEGAILDWGALLITGEGLVSKAQGGLGYTIFAIAMTAGRFSGDFMTARFGDRAVLFWGGLASIAGFAILLASRDAVIAMTGFLPIGIGISNIVPVLFRRSGAQRAMPIGLAVAAITTAGYSGILVGPAVVGFVAKIAGLPTAFWLLASLVGCAVLSARVVTTDPL